MQTLVAPILLLASATTLAQEPDLQQWVQVDNVLLETEAAAAYAVQLVKGGVSLNFVAARWTADPGGYGERGGQLPVARCSEYVPEFARAACMAEVGLVGTVRTAFGWHVFRVNARSADKAQVPGPRPMGISPFAADLVLSCAFSAAPSKSFQVSIDKKGKAAKFGERPGLLLETETHFKVLKGDLSVMQIDRTTGTSMVLAADGVMSSEIQCRPAAQRRF